MPLLLVLLLIVIWHIYSYYMFNFVVGPPFKTLGPPSSQ